MQEDQTPQNTYIAGDDLALSFEFQHEMNVTEVTANFVKTGSGELVTLVGTPTPTNEAGISSVTVDGYIDYETTPGDYTLRTIIVSTGGGREVIMTDIPNGMNFRVLREPITPPRFRQLI